LINTRFRTAKREENEENKSLIKALPALQRILARAADCLARPGMPPSPGIDALFNAGGEAESQIYITFDEGRIYLVTAHTESEALNGEAVERMRELMEQTRTEVPGLNVGLTGEPVLEHDEMVQSQKDTTLASIVSLLICAAIFIYGYNETGRPLKATLCLIIGLGYTMAFATLTVGHLNILTITFVPMLIGLAIDFGVHLVTRYEEELRHGKSEVEAITKAMVFTGQGIFTGALTTAVAFTAMSFTNFKGIQEMGIICGGGLMVCLVPMMTMLPALLLRGRQNVIDHAQGDKLDARARIEQLWLQRPRIVLVLTLASCVVAGWHCRTVFFDYNLLNMQSAGLPAVEFEKKLIHSAGKSVLFGVVIADSVQEAAALEAKLSKLPAVSEVISLSKFLDGDPAAKLQIIRRIKRDLKDVDFVDPDTRPVDIPELSRTLYSFYGYLGLAMEEAAKDDPALARQLAGIRTATEHLRKAMLHGSPGEVAEHAEKLAAYQQALFEDVGQTFDALREQDASSPLTAADLPPSLRDRFVGVTGKYLLQVFPKQDVWQRENQRELIREVQPVYPNFTGTPVQLFEYTELLKTSYEQAAVYALAAIVIMVLVHFRSLAAVGLALLPVGIGALWLGGLMGGFQIPLNPANIMTLPLVIGIGVTNGIHILNRYAEELKPSILARSTGKAVLVSGLTTIAGFGSLILADHQGIKTLGYVMATGVATCMFAALTVLPAILKLRMRWYSEKNQPSVDNAQSTLGREEPR
jgi:hopanoid biosynthesis associated RND transporter like protein HpnN